MKNILYILTLCTLTATAQPLYTLQQFKDSALLNNFAVRSARSAVAQSALQRSEARTAYYPQVGATAFAFEANRGMAHMEVNPSELLPSELSNVLGGLLPAEILSGLGNPVGFSMMKDGVVAGVNAVQPVFMGGQIVNGNRLARVGEDVSRLQLEVAENDVELQTEQYYWQLVCLLEKRQTLWEAQRTVDSLHKDVSLAVEAGVTMRNDLLQVNLRRNELQSQALQLENGIGLVKLLLAQYCGLADTLFTLAPEADAPADVLPPTGTVAALPEFRLLEKQVEAADLNLRLERGKLLPTLAIGAGLNYHNLLQNDRTFGMVFATLSIPISNWWGGSYAVRRKRTALQVAQWQRDDNASLLEIRRQKAWNDVREAAAQLDLAREAIAEATENLRLSRDYYHAGLSTMSDLLQAQLLHRQALDRHTDARATYHTRLLQYRQATVGR
ncbi:MAG: TolC family protein [Bacteroidaceae bacterium]|nr:TolC family protein [Bacteroidaceae bacterium]